MDTGEVFVLKNIDKTVCPNAVKKKNGYKRWETSWGCRWLEQHILYGQYINRVIARKK